MKTLDEIKEDLAVELGFDKWKELCDDTFMDDVIFDITNRYANERRAEIESSLKGRIAELESEIVVLKALKRENN